MPILPKPIEDPDEPKAKPVGLPGAQAGFGSLKPVIDQSFQQMVAQGAPPVQAPPPQPHPQPFDPDMLAKLMILLRGGPNQDRQVILGTR